MKRKNRLQISLAAAFMALALVACGPSDEKLVEAEEARSLLLGARNTAQETFLDITDSSKKAELDELAAQVAEIEAMDFTKLNDKKIDELLPSIKELTDKYQSLDSSLSEVLQKETEDKAEKAKHLKTNAYIINKTGFDITEITLHDKSTDTYSDNYLGDGVVLKAGYSLMGIELDVYTDSSDWEFVVKDGNNTPHIFECESLAGLDLEGVSVEFVYDSKTEVGKVTIGGYTASEDPNILTPAPSEASSASGSSEAASEASSAE